MTSGWQCRHCRSERRIPWEVKQCAICHRFTHPMYRNLDGRQMPKEVEETETDPCSICGNPIDVQTYRNRIVWTQGHNAQPVNDGRCCSYCNDTVVIPRRIKDTFRKEV